MKKIKGTSKLSVNDVARKANKTELSSFSTLSEDKKTTKDVIEKPLDNLTLKADSLETKKPNESNGFKGVLDSLKALFMKERVAETPVTHVLNLETISEPGLDPIDPDDEKTQVTMEVEDSEKSVESEDLAESDEFESVPEPTESEVVPEIQNPEKSVEPIEDHPVVLDHVVEFEPAVDYDLSVNEEETKETIPVIKPEQVATSEPFVEQVIETEATVEPEPTFEPEHKNGSEANHSQKTKFNAFFGNIRTKAKNEKSQQFVENDIPQTAEKQERENMSAFEGKSMIQDESIAIISANMTVQGDIELESALLLAGKVKGNIICKSKLQAKEGSRIEGNIQVEAADLKGGEISGNIQSETIVEISDKTLVSGDISAMDIVIAGKVNGQITAKNSVTLSKTANVKGDLTAVSISVESGAKLEGKFTVVSPEAE